AGRPALARAGRIGLCAALPRRLARARCDLPSRHGLAVVDGSICRGVGARTRLHIRSKSRSACQISSANLSTSERGWTRSHLRNLRRRTAAHTTRLPVSSVVVRRIASHRAQRAGLATLRGVVAGIGDPGRAGSITLWSKQSTLAKTDAMHKHLRRLERVWIDWPIYFITSCTFKRRSILVSKEVAKILVDEWQQARERHGWAVGRYVIMPDHVHFFCSAELDAKRLPTFMQAWKQWTSKRMARELKFRGKVWQEEFFDHVLRSSESYGQKWDYVKENPVRAGLVKRSDEWPWQGEIESLML